MVGNRDDPAAENSSGPIRTPLPPIALPTDIPFDPPIRRGARDENADEEALGDEDEGKADEAKDDAPVANGNVDAVKDKDKHEHVLTRE